MAFQFTLDDIVTPSISHPYSAASNEEIPWDQQSTMSLERVLDPTSLEIEFDYSCLDYLDDQLLLRATEAFADVCWATLVEERPTPTREALDMFDYSSTTRYQPRTSHEDSDDSFSDDDPTTPVFETRALRTDDFDSYLDSAKGDFSSDDMFSDDEKASFIFFEPQVLGYTRKHLAHGSVQPINHFPVPVVQDLPRRGPMQSRFMTLNQNMKRWF